MLFKIKPLNLLEEINKLTTSKTGKKVKTSNQKAHGKSVKVGFGVWTVVKMFVSKKLKLFHHKHGSLIQTHVYSGYCCLKSNPWIF